MRMSIILILVAIGTGIFLGVRSGLIHTEQNRIFPVYAFIAWGILFYFRKFVFDNGLLSFLTWLAVGIFLGSAQYLVKKR
jgi:hypothetical protein